MGVTMEGLLIWDCSAGHLNRLNSTYFYFSLSTLFSFCAYAGMHWILWLDLAGQEDLQTIQNKTAKFHHIFTQLSAKLYFFSGTGGLLFVFCEWALQSSGSSRWLASNSRRFPGGYFLFVFTFIEPVLSKSFFHWSISCHWLHFFLCNDILWQRSPKGHVQLKSNFQRENRKQTVTH